MFDRVTIFNLEYGDAPVFVRTDDLLIEAVHVPHSGWPTARTDVQNIAFRITLEDTSTVLHLGDADARLVHFEQDENFWDERRVDLAFPPYWFFRSADGREILEDWVRASRSIGIHVPAEFGEDASTIPSEPARRRSVHAAGRGTQVHRVPIVFNRSDVITRRAKPDAATSPTLWSRQKIALLRSQ